MWQSDDGINWTGPISVKQKQLDISQSEYDSSIGFRGKYGAIQREGGTNANSWYPTSSDPVVVLTTG